MIIVIVTKEKNFRTGRMEEIVSHGIDLDTGQSVVIPNVNPKSIGTVFDLEIGEYVLNV